MSEQSQISWCTSTWNPVVGCQKVSAGCDNCYAIRDGWRMGHNPNKKVRAAYSALVYRLNGRLNWTGAVRTLPDRLEVPLHWKAPRRIFVNSQSDLFHKDVPFEFIDLVFGVMAAAKQHTFQVLTKRPERMLEYMSQESSALVGRIDTAACTISDSPCAVGDDWPLPNVWLGVSVENQKTADERVPLLQHVPAAVRFISYEPALGPIEIEEHLMGMTSCHRPNWVIVGGESGPGARPFNINWARQVIRQCKAAGCAVFVKQLGARPYACRNSVNGKPDHAGCIQEGLEDIKNKKGDDPSEWSEDLRVQQFPQHLPKGESVAGRR